MTANLPPGTSEIISIPDEVQHNFKVGDIVECISKDPDFKTVYGCYFTVTDVMPNWSRGMTHLRVSPAIPNKSTPMEKHFKPVAQSKPEPSIKRNLAFYKRSAEPWTREDLNNIYSYCGDICTVYKEVPTRTYIFDDGESSDFMHDWNQQKDHHNFSKCEQIAYEDIFHQLKKPINYEAAITKEVIEQECSPELTTKSIQKDNIMTKLKDTAVVTVGQNKEALIIAAKMEAGRIINKQVLKQLSPHLPFFLQGYTKSPLAPIVAANLVAMAANHTKNPKLSKVSELMLLGAADSGVTAFNLDKIVDDILSGVKLPKGVLDDEE